MMSSLDANYHFLCSWLLSAESFLTSFMFPCVSERIFACASSTMWHPLIFIAYHGSNSSSSILWGELREFCSQWGNFSMPAWPWWMECIREKSSEVQFSKLSFRRTPNQRQSLLWNLCLEIGITIWSMLPIITRWRTESTGSSAQSSSQSSAFSETGRRVRRVLLSRGTIVSWARGSRRQIGHSFFSRSGVCYAGFRSSGKLPRKGGIHISQIDLSLKESPWLSGWLFNRTLCGLLSHVGCHVSWNLKTRHQILKLEGLTSHEPLHKPMKGGSSHNASPKLVFKVSFEKG